MDIEVRDQIIASYPKMGIKKIADLVGYSYSAVRNTLINNGVDLQGPGGDRGNRHAWKGGRCLTSDGYVMIRKNLIEEEYMCMSYSNNYVLEHRLVMARHIGRPLKTEETVHHINGDKSDNRIENLQLRIGHHGKGSSFRCRSCGSIDVEGVMI